jgi:hypothetical protein
VVHANGVPTIVRLAYIEGLSNWGPRDASGTLELALGEGYAKLDLQKMEPLTGKKYQGWLVNSQSNDAVSVGTFNASANGVVTHRQTLPAIADFGFDLFIITVEPDPDDAPQPTSERSIGGRFSLIGARTPDGLSGEPLGGGSIAGPRQLPNTGLSWMPADFVRVALLLGAGAAAVAAGVQLGRRRA